MNRMPAIVTRDHRTSVTLPWTTTCGSKLASYSISPRNAIVVVVAHSRCLFQRTNHTTRHSAILWSLHVVRHPPHPSFDPNGAAG